MLRRKKDETEVKLPARRVMTTPVVFDDESMRFYQGVEAGAKLEFKGYLKVRLAEGSSGSGKILYQLNSLNGPVSLQDNAVMEKQMFILALLNKLRQACDHMLLLR